MNGNVHSSLGGKCCGVFFFFSAWHQILVFFLIIKSDVWSLCSSLQLQYIDRLRRHKALVNNFIRFSNVRHVQWHNLDEMCMLLLYKV